MGKHKKPLPWADIEYEVRQHSGVCVTESGTDNVTAETCFFCGALATDDCGVKKQLDGDWAIAYLRAREAARG